MLLVATLQNGPTVNELRISLKEYLIAEGYVHRLERQMYITRWAQEHGHLVLWTPPNRSIINPIEIVWRNLKAYIRNVSLRAVQVVIFSVLLCNI